MYSIFDGNLGGGLASVAVILLAIYTSGIVSGIKPTLPQKQQPLTITKAAILTQYHQSFIPTVLETVLSIQKWAQKQFHALFSSTVVPSVVNDLNADFPPDVHPWPSFRANCENTGFVAVRTVSKLSGSGGTADGSYYWSFQTGRGIFSVPAISADGRVLIGSADRKFYALDEKTGRPIWHITTDEIIDSAASLHKTNVIFASGDGHIYNASIATGQISWTFAAHHRQDSPDQHLGLTCGGGGTGAGSSTSSNTNALPAAIVNTNNNNNNKNAGIISAVGGTSTWFEGQVTISTVNKDDTRIYVGNDDYRLYSVHANGTEAYSFYPGPLPYGTIWSGPAVTRSGSVIGTAMNGKYFKLDRNGKCIWFHEEMNSISSGPAVDADLTMVFVGAWNGIMRGVNHTNGQTLWTFSAGDSIYGGVAVDAARRRIYFGSQDGVFYALNSVTGKSVWRFRVNYPIRTSPALALDALYFGASNGMVYALEPESGLLIWAFDTTEDLDHREINASPALGHTSVIFGSEDGRIISIPYRYCVDKKTAKSDTRCINNDKITSNTTATTDIIADGRNLYYIHPGGKISHEIPDAFPIIGDFHIRLLIVTDNKTRAAHILRATADLSPPIGESLTIEYLSTSGSILVKHDRVPFLESATRYNLTVTMFDNSMASTKRVFSFMTAANDDGDTGVFPQSIIPIPNDVSGDSNLTVAAAKVLHFYNLKPSYPPSWISLNQIGFDSVNLLISVIHRITPLVNLRQAKNQNSKNSVIQYVVWIAAGLLNQDGSIISLDPTMPTLATGVLTIHTGGGGGGTAFSLSSQFSLITGGPPIPMTGFTVSAVFDTGSQSFGNVVKNSTSSGSKKTQSWMSWSSWCGDSISSLIGAIQTNMCSSRGRIVSVGAVRGRIYEENEGEESFIGRVARGWTVKEVIVKSGGWIATEYNVVVRIINDGGGDDEIPAVFGIVLFDERRQVPIHVDYGSAMSVSIVEKNTAVVLRLVVPGVLLNIAAGSAGVAGGVLGKDLLRVIVMINMYPAFNSIVNVDAVY
ncbi:hypothetical protein HK100_002029 [Physocladia obscura]|uniref:Pyrrolo-quinoline quinone repeat domain-containing protein n=1 Tax=Physocladia obscura TaxID=109957 RepID=A0AAD5XLH2_9FUNG|nr:hypothetical protein HK100_002029 [Physocladia obscura]